MEMQMVKQSTKLIKPSTPTPPTLAHFKIGFIDEVAPTINVSVVLFFSVNTDDNAKFVAQLQESLEKTLIRFYPLAGRYVEETHTVDCSDQGAEFIHAKLNINLQDFLDSEVKVKLRDEFIPSEVIAADRITDPILAIQVTTFECGGVALGVSIAHRIADASTLSTFLTEWAAISITREENVVEFTGPRFNTSALFPARGLPPMDVGLPRSISNDMVSKNVTKKLSFNDSELSNLKEKAMINGRKGTTPPWSKVQLVTALILKAFIGVDRAKHDHPRDCILLQPINLREKTASFIPKDSCGNLWGLLAIDCGTAETTEELADVIRDSIKNSINNYYLKVRHDSEEGQAMVLNSVSHLTNSNPGMANVIWVTSWCNFPFYEADFGFGKPIWASCASLPVKNTAFLMDGVGGNGVEAYVCIEAEDVSYFEEALDMKEAFVG